MRRLYQSLARVSSGSSAVSLLSTSTTSSAATSSSSSSHSKLTSSSSSSFSSPTATQQRTSWSPKALPKRNQIAGGRTYEWETSQAKFGRASDISEALEDQRRTEAHRQRVAGWTPVVKVLGDQRLRVALVGRMNSGKSSLYNLLVQDPLIPKKKNTVKDLDGVTRDPVEGIGKLGNLTFTVIDTPGLVKGQMVEEALRSIATADLVLMVAAVDEDISPEERQLVAFLNSMKLPTFLVVNKMDLVAADDEPRILQEYTESLSLGNAIPLSTRRQDGLEMLSACIEPFIHLQRMHQIEQDWDTEDLAMEGDEMAMDDIRHRNSTDRFIRVAIIGRTNSGKSSLINRLVGYERNRVSSELNTTRDAVEIPCVYKGRKLKIIDTAGATRTRFRSDREFLGRMHYLAVNEMRFAHVCIVVFDATEGHPNKYDMSLLYQVASEGRPFILCANKWDAVLDPSATAEAIDFKIKRQMKEIKYSNAVVVSAQTGMNLTLLLDQALTLYDRWNKRVKSKELTKFWRKLEKSVIIPYHVARIGRLAQVNTRPPTFRLNLQTRDDENEFPPALQEMLKSALVEEFGFQGVPIRLIQEVKDSHPDYI